MKFRQRAEGTFPVVFQVTSFVDILLVLVIFLLVSYAQGQMESELRVSVPGASNAQPQAAISRIIVNILKDGSVVLNGRQQTSEQLSATLDKLVRNDPGLSVIVRADKQVGYEKVLKVMDLCEGAKVESVGFAALKN